MSKESKKSRHDAKSARASKQETKAAATLPPESLTPSVGKPRRRRFVQDFCKFQNIPKISPNHQVHLPQIS